MFWHTDYFTCALSPFPLHPNRSTLFLAGGKWTVLMTRKNCSFSRNSLAAWTLVCCPDVPWTPEGPWSKGFGLQARLLFLKTPETNSKFFLRVVLQLRRKDPAVDHANVGQTIPRNERNAYASIPRGERSSWSWVYFLSIRGHWDKRFRGVFLLILIPAKHWSNVQRSNS